MFGFLVRRVVAGISVILVVMAAAFALFFFGPSDPVRQLCGDRQCPSETYKQVKKSLELDKPATTQFTSYLKGVAVGRDFQNADQVVRCPAPCLGYSYRQKLPVTDLIVQAIPVTLSVAIGAALIFLAIGIPLGSLAAINRGSTLDKALVGSTLVISSFPYYLVALLAMLYLSVYTSIFPRGGWTAPWDNPLAWLSGMLLPWFALALFYCTSYARYTRAAMVETLGEDFIRTARAKGLTKRTVNFKHALRASLTAVFTILGIDLAGLFAGTIFTERIFDVQGIGLLTLDAFTGGDLPVIMGTLIYSATILVAMNIVVDIVYSFLDPRVRLS